MADDPRLGTLLSGKYRIERVLGEGGMGIVYAARHTRLDRPVAIKFLHASYAKNKSALDRFFVEARAAGQLRHPNVVDVVDLDTDGEAPFMVLELLDGESLAALLARRKRLPVDEALAIVLAVLDALGTAHARGIVHRDIKPDNVFLAREADRVVPKLLDFGIAKLRDGSQLATNTGTAMGTPMYMSPEQARGAVREIGPASDVWAMGAMLFECLTGSLPFAFEPEAGPYALVALVATGRPRRLAEVMPDAPAAVAAAVDGALEVDASKRLPSAAAMRATLLGERLPTFAVAATLVASAGEASSSLALPATRVSSVTRAPWALVVMVAVSLVVATLVVVGLGLSRMRATAVEAAPPPTTTVTAMSPATVVEVEAESEVEGEGEREADGEVEVEVEAPPPRAPRVRASEPPAPHEDAVPRTVPPATQARTETRTGTWDPDDL